MPVRETERNAPIDLHEGKALQFRKNKIYLAHIYRAPPSQNGLIIALKVSISVNCLEEKKIKRERDREREGESEREGTLYVVIG